MNQLGIVCLAAFLAKLNSDSMQKQVFYLIIGLGLFSLVASNICLWIIVSINKPFLQARSEYLQKFPEIIQNGQVITSLNILLLAAALFLFHRAKTEQRLKVFALTFFYISIVLISWNLFSLM